MASWLGTGEGTPSSSHTDSFPVQSRVHDEAPQESWYRSHSWISWKEWAENQEDASQEPPLMVLEAFTNLGLDHLLCKPQELTRFLHSAKECRDLLEVTGFNDIFQQPSELQELKMQLQLLHRVTALFQEHGVAAMMKEPFVNDMSAHCEDLKNDFETIGYPRGFLRVYSQLREGFKDLGLEHLLDNTSAMKRFLLEHKESHKELEQLRAKALRLDQVEDTLKRREEELARAFRANDAMRDRLSTFEDVPWVPQQRSLLPILHLEQDAGRLLPCLAHWGAVFLAPGWDPDNTRPNWVQWYTLMHEATRERKKFHSRECVQGKHLRFSASEDLSRTMLGEAKTHQADRRVAFGVSDSAVQSRSINWDELRWVVEAFRKLKASLCRVVERELQELCAEEVGDRASLGVKMKRRLENWGKSNLRHCIYPENGTCTTHTDYGLVTLQYSTGPGLQVWHDETWVTLEAPEDCALLMAGDSLERLTNGRVKALHHRVCMADGDEFDSRSLTGARQSHIIFLSPNADTVVAPLKSHLRHDGTDLEPVRYGDWHKTKVDLAFEKPWPRVQSRYQ